MTQSNWWERVEDAMHEHQRANPDTLPGAVFAAETASSGRFVGSVGDGWSSETICEIGSMTKPFIAAAALLALEERDMLDVELPVYRLPGMSLYAIDPIKRQVRLRHLLQHTSGLPHFHHYAEWPKTSCNDPAGEIPCACDPDLDLGRTSAWIGAPGLTNELVFARGKCRPARAANLDAVSQHIMSTYPVAASPQPGSQYLYSTVNYILVARIIENLTGKPVNLFVKEKLLDPLEMKDSFFIASETGDPTIDAWMNEGVTEEQRARIADLTLITRDRRLPPEMAPGPDGGWDKLRRGWRFVNPDGGMFSTANDLLNFLHMLRDGGRFQGRRVLSERISKLLVEDQGFGHTMGFGFRRQNTPYGQGPGTLEYLGFKMTYFWIDPSSEDPLLGVFLSQRLPNVLVNANLGEGMQVIFRIFVPLARSEVSGAVVHA